MKKIAAVGIVALVLVALVWVLFLKTRSNNNQECCSSKQRIVIAPKPPAVPPASNEAEKSRSANEQRPAAVPVPAVQPKPAAEAAVVDVITSGGELETNVFKDAFIKRCRPIAINPQLLEKAGKLEPGSRLSLALFPDTKYSVTLQTVNRSPQGDLSIGGKLDGQEYGTFVLSTGGGVVLAKLADPSTKQLFLIRCLAQNHAQYAVEVDVEKTPVPGNISNSNANKQ